MNMHEQAHNRTHMAAVHHTMHKVAASVFTVPTTQCKRLKKRKRSEKPGQSISVKADVR